MRHLIVVTTLALGVVAGITTLERRAAAQAEDDLKEGDRYFEEGEYRKAAAAYDNAIRKYPGQV